MKKTAVLFLLASAREAAAQGAPSITCPDDVILEADASCSASYDGPAATATDDEDMSPSVGPELPAALGGPGVYVITHTATDDDGNTASCDQTVTVVDAAPPTVSSWEATPTCLWPPNHKMVAFQLDENLIVEVADNCDADPVLEFSSATSSEPEDGRGDGHTTPDFLAGDEGFCLRSERAGGGGGRTYAVEVRAVDAAGNASEDAPTIDVRVPHDQSGHGCDELSAVAFVEDEASCGTAAMGDDDAPEPGAAGCSAAAATPDPVVALLLLGLLAARRTRLQPATQAVRAPLE